MSRASAIFDEMTSSGSRARCPRVEPTGCQGRKKEFHIQVEPDHAYCHRCQHTWHFEDNKIDKMPDIKPPIVREPLYVKSSGAVKKSNYRDKAKRNGLKKFLSELRIDHELTPKEKFELYYDEYRSLKKQEEGKTLRETLKKAGIKKPPGNSQTPKK